MDLENRPPHANNQQTSTSGSVKAKPKFSIDDIRASLKKKGAKESPPRLNTSSIPTVTTTGSATVTASPAKTAARPVPRTRGGSVASAKNPAEVIRSEDTNAIKEKFIELAVLCEEIFAYCHLVENSRSATVAESLGLRETLRELEKLLDSARQREIDHLNYVEQHREAIAQFEKRYYSLKARARGHIKECQDSRDKLKVEAESLNAKLKSTESDLYAAQSLVHSQQTELERLREQTRNMPSERELTTMSLKLRKLEDENGRLATERAKLIAQLDEASGNGGKDRSGTRPAPGPSRKEAELENALEDSKATIQQLKRQVEEAQASAERYREYVEALLEQIPSQNQ